MTDTIKEKDTPQTAEEILKDLNITPDTKFHSFKYLFPTILKAMNMYADQEVDEALRRHGVVTNPSKEFRETVRRIEKALSQHETKSRHEMKAKELRNLKNPTNPSNP